jgi:hypothetical protein
MPKVHDNTGLGAGPYRNPPPPPPGPAPAPPAEKRSSVGGRIAKWLLIATAGSIVGVVVTKKWGDWFGGNKDDDGDAPPQGAMGWPGMPAGYPQITPIPLPYPMPMPMSGFGGYGGGYGGPPMLPPGASASVTTSPAARTTERFASDDEVTVYAPDDEDAIYAAEMRKFRARRAKKRARKDAEIEDIMEEFESDVG